MIWHRLLSSFALTLLLLSPVMAQTPGEGSLLDQQQKRLKELELKQELERKTFALLEDVISSAPTLKLPENRALVLSSVADLLWARDEKRARALFRDALHHLSSTALRFNPQMSDEQRRAHQIYMQQRQEILQMIARRDVDLALEMLRASRPPAATAAATNKDLRLPDEEARLEHGLAIQVALNDPKRAYQMAEDNLAKGLSFDSLNLLAQLNDRDAELAGRFATHIISKIRSESLSTNHEALWVAVMLLRMGVPPEDDGTGTIVSLGTIAGGRTQFRLEERQIKDLLEMVTTVALGGTANASLLTLLPPLMPEIERRMPERAAPLRRRIAESARTLDPQERVIFEFQELRQNGTIEALLEAAAKAQDKVRNVLYEQAAWKALYKGDAERARRIVEDYIRDASIRERILEGIDRMALWEAMRKERINEVRQQLTRIKKKEERASILVQLAYGAAIKKERKLALELLNEALPLVNFKPKKEDELHTLLQVGRIYALVEPVKAFELMESLIDQANTLLSAASVLNGFFLPSGVFRKGEMVLPPGYSNATMRFRQLGKELAALALFNFERTKAAADRFQRNEARILARLFILQGVLSEQIGSGVALYGNGLMVGY
jgi:hypothetical protein